MHLIRTFSAGFSALSIRIFLLLALSYSAGNEGMSQVFPGDCQTGLQPCSYNNAAAQLITDIPFNSTGQYNLLDFYNSLNFYVDSGQVYLFRLNQQGNYTTPQLRLFRLPDFQQPELICSNTSEIRWLADFSGYIAVQVNESDCEVRFHQDFDPALSIEYRKFTNPLVNCNPGNQAELGYGCGTNAQGQGFFEFNFTTPDLVSDTSLIPDTMEIFFKRSDEPETVSSWLSGIKAKGIPGAYNISGQTFYQRSFEAGRVFGDFYDIGYDFRYRFVCNGEAGPMSDITCECTPGRSSGPLHCAHPPHSSQIFAPFRGYCLK